MRHYLADYRVLEKMINDEKYVVIFFVNV